MIKIIYEDGQCRPVVFCDICQERIEDASTANYYWRPLWGQECQARDLFVAHCKCDCLVDRVCGEHMAYEPLESLPLFLGRNLNMAISAPNRKRKGLVETLSELGLGL